MPEDYYSDGGEAPASSKAGETPQTGAGADDQPTGVLPKSILAGKKFKPGDEVVLEIVRIHDDEIEVKYASEKGKEEESEAPDGREPEPASAPSGMSSMYD